MVSGHISPLSYKLLSEHSHTYLFLCSVTAHSYKKSLGVATEMVLPVKPMVFISGSFIGSLLTSSPKEQLVSNWRDKELLNLFADVKYNTHCSF